MVIRPFDELILTEDTFAVADGAVQPLAKGAALAAFSDTAVLAAEANDKPSVTFARTV